MGAPEGRRNPEVAGGMAHAFGMSDGWVSSPVTPDFSRSRGKNAVEAEGAHGGKFDSGEKVNILWL